MEQLPEKILQNVEAIVGLQVQQSQTVPRHHRLLEKIAIAFGQPWFLYTQVLFFTAWGIFSYLKNIGLIDWPFSTFYPREQALDMIALIISTGVLIYQTRQEKVSDERSNLILQLNLITEQKIAKLIALVEELRVDLPDVRDRSDIEAEAMQQITDPQVVLEILQETLKQPSTVTNQQAPP